jgi:hypothetical protein
VERIRTASWASLLLLALCRPALGDGPAKTGLQVGFGETDLTPAWDKNPVYLAGFGHNRQARGVHDPIMARAIVLHHGRQQFALVSVDVVGLFHPAVERVRKKLTDFDYVLVSSTHNHEGPDTLGLWGPSPVKSGLDPAYLARVEDGIVQAVRRAAGSLRNVDVRIGKARAPDLVRDSRQPIVKHDELVVLHFVERGTNQSAGLLVQWNCHPETLDSRNTLISADFVWATVAYLRQRRQCPVVYLTGTVGGLMTSLGVEVKDDRGQSLKDGTFEKTEQYGRLVGKLAETALAAETPIELCPLRAHTRQVFLPLDNKLYVLGWKLGVLDRQAFLWDGDWRKARPAPGNVPSKTRLAIRSELAWLQLGDLQVAAIPGEIYPELVLGGVQEPPDPGADFPKAEVEPAIYKQFTGRHRMLIGLANDEVGYIIPKRQWDEKPPFCYGRKRSQYGEINSLGPETAPIICNAFRDLVKPK